MFPNDPIVHTQTIESTCLLFKGKLRNQFGTMPEMFNGYLFGFCFRKLLRNDKKVIFSRMLIELNINKI